MPYATPARGPKTKRLAEARLRRLIFDGSGEWDAVIMEEVRRQVPDAWHMVEMDVDVAEPKEKVTLYLDRSVARCFRAMGKGYHARINRILATWVQMRIAEVKALEVDLLEALQTARAEKDAPDPEDWSARTCETLEEHWAYLQGYAAGRAARTAEEGDRPDLDTDQCEGPARGI